MNPHNVNGWPPGSGQALTPQNSEHFARMQQRQQGSFGSSHGAQQGPSLQLGGSTQLQPNGPFYAPQPNGHVLPNIPTIPQASPGQMTRQPLSMQLQQSPPSGHIHQPHSSNYALPGLHQAIQQQSPQSTGHTERDRELREQEAREFDYIEHQRQQELIMQRERERELREQQHHIELPQPPLENHTGSIPLQQPVASRVPGSLHGPNGILTQLGAGAGINSPSGPLGAPSGPSNIFPNGASASNENAQRQYHSQQGQVIPPQQLLGLGRSMTPQASNGFPAVAVAQGQQPILNDALSYLDQVKVRFVDQPDVYNRFLDIMKDFKSQAIDTPGVINRVSSLFAGHPELIQGFNTFLPPGYRIECGTSDDPNTIRVTTPMGTTLQQMPSVQDRLTEDQLVAERSYYEGGPHPNGNWQHPNQAQSDMINDGPFSPNARVNGASLLGGMLDSVNGESQYDRVETAVADAAALAHQQEQRGVSHLSNAVSVATSAVQSRHLGLVSPDSGLLSQGIGLSTGVPGLSGSQLGLEKRGPVEFNHAISYVNKIKNRFSSQPEIYKQFLEILQTYQRESKPIQDVYAQVTQLFNGAPDLLEDFKQFLPESAAQAKAQAAAARQANDDAVMLSNVRGDPSYVTNMQRNQSYTPRPDTKLPPMGNFAPTPSTNKENKKRKGGAGSTLTGGAASASVPDVNPAGGQAKTGGTQNGNANKRAKLQQPKPTPPEIPAVSPSLVPSLPQPLAPVSNNSGIGEDFAFFDRVRKYIANKQTFNEFLKLCNMFTQDLIDKNLLIHKANGFIGGNPDMMNFFKTLLRYDGRDEIVENKARISEEKVVLSNCRGLGPSYRLLPKRERLRSCSGRDELCKKVLNDEWACHPTWASEDSGFQAHRKNVHEDTLHKIEEERHDYDYNIETCARTIQLLEPIAHHLRALSDEDRENYILPKAIGGQSDIIWQRVIKKIYNRVPGQKVIDDIFRRPSAVVPIVLSRLKQKLEEWKAGQREWEKVWREQTHKIFWKSLDHQNINLKTADKRQCQPKVLVTEIQTKREEQKRQRLTTRDTLPKYQLQYAFEDMDVVHDTCHVLLTHLRHGGTGNASDHSKIENFIKTFVPVFFDLDSDSFQRRMNDIYDSTPPNEEVEEDDQIPEDSSTGRNRRFTNGKKGTLLRGVLDRGQSGKPGRKDRDGLSICESKESTPDVVSMDEDVSTPMDTGSDHNSRLDPTEFRWMEHPSTGNTGTRKDKPNIDPRKPYKRETFYLYANINIYCFFRTFEMLYTRLLNIKLNEANVHNDVRRAKMPKPAHDLRIADKSPTELFPDTSPNTNYYRQLVKMFEEVAKGDYDGSLLEETLRRFYVQDGWQLFGLEKLVGSILRFALAILVSDNKDKSLEVINLFYKDRVEDETTHESAIAYRRQVEKLVKEGDIYRIAYVRQKKRAQIQIFGKDEKTFEADEITREAQWAYYVSSWTMRQPTEGMDLSQIRWPHLRRNLPPASILDDEYKRIWVPQSNSDELILRICPDNYRMLFDKLTMEWFDHDPSVKMRGAKRLEEVTKQRTEKFREKFGTNPQWMVGMSLDVITRINERFQRWFKEGLLPDTETQINGVQGATKDEDTEL